MVVYVDEFKMAGPAEAMKEAWSLLRKQGPNGTKGLKMDEPKAGNMRYLGCEHKYAKRPVPPNRNFLVEITEKQPKPPKKKATQVEKPPLRAVDPLRRQTLHTSIKSKRNSN